MDVSASGLRPEVPPAARQGAGRAAQSPWQMPLSAWKQVARRTWQQSSQDNVSIVAAGVAFYGFLAMVPMMGAVILIYGLAADPQSVVRHATSLTNILPADVAGLVGDQLLNLVQTSGGKKGLGLVVAIAVALWGARNAASAVITALNIAYEEQEKRGFLRVTLLSLLMTAGAVAMALLGALAIAMLAALEHLVPGLGAAGVVVGKVLTYVLLGAVAAAGAAAMFRYGPSRDRAQWTWISPGSLFFAGGWILLTLAFGLYVSQFGNYGATYGSLSAIVVLLTWLYLSSYVLLLAAELNSELEHQTGQDTTAGAAQPLGERGAWAADNVAGEDAGAAAPKSKPQVTTAETETPAPPTPPSEHPYLTSRVTARAARAAGLSKVGMVSSVLATVGLARLRRRGSEASGAAILLSAAGLALLRRED